MALVFASERCVRFVWCCVCVCIVCICCVCRYCGCVACIAKNACRLAAAALCSMALESEESVLFTGVGRPFFLFFGFEFGEREDD